MLSYKKYNMRSEYAYSLDIDDLFQRLLPPKPYCSDNLKKGLLIRPRNTAMKKKYIQLNPPHQIAFMVIDIDYKVEYAIIAEDCNLPNPMFCVANPRNHHVHLIYVLKQPVYKTEMAHLAPLKYFKAIYDAYCERLCADPMYSGLIAKNPLSDKWWVFMLTDQLYTLEDLANYVDLTRKPTKKPIEEIAGLGRNCYIFEHVRVWSYSAIRDFWGHKFSEWFDAVKFKCGQENAKFSEPLYDPEINQIVKSIAHWTWKRITPEEISNWHRRQVNKRWHSQKEKGMDMLLEGCPIDTVASELGVTRQTVYNWLKAASPEEVKKISEFKPENLSETKPWEALGISRRWYYELKKRGEI